MPSKKTDPHTATTRHQIYLQRLASHEAGTFDTYLKKSDKIVRDVLSKGEIANRKQLTKILAETQKKLNENYRGWTDLLIGDLKDISESEADFSTQLMKNATTNTVIASAPLDAAWTAANVVPIQITTGGESKLLRPLLQEFTVTEVARVNGIIRNGFYAGQTSGQIIQLIRGTKANQFKDGALDISRRAASAIAQTSTNHAAVTARMATLEANSKVLDGWIFSATLDNRTTTQCRHYDGEKFSLGEGPMPPLHINCRSSIVPAVKKGLTPFDDDGPRVSVGSKGGAVTGKSPYYNWLETQPAWFQDDVLGKTMGDVFRNSGLSTDAFRKLTVNNMGKPLTIQQMKLKNPSIFGDN